MRLSVKLSVAVHCLVFISEYGESAKVTGEKLAMSGGTNSVIVRGILSSLKKAGIINVKSGFITTINTSWSNIIFNVINFKKRFYF